MDMTPAPNRRQRIRLNNPAEMSPQLTPAATPKVTVGSGNAPTPSPSKGASRKRKACQEKTPEAPPVVATGQQKDLAPFKTMSPVELTTLLAAGPPNNYQVTNPQYILIDTQNSINFNKCRVKSNHVARFPINPDALAVAQKSEVFGSKGAVVNYFLKNKPDFLNVLQSPGFYNCMVVLSEDGVCSTSKLKSFMNALIKWNENTPTAICILEGGVQAFSNMYSHLSVFGTMVSPVVPAACITTAPASAINASLDDCLKILDAMIITSKFLIKLASKLKSLSSVLSVLREGELEIRKRHVVPKALLCPACLKFLSGEILLCDKGHSVCSGCYSRMELKICGHVQCGAPISGNSRNWSLEQTLAVGVSRPCVCDQMVKVTESEAHFEECVSKVEEFGRIQQLISEIHPQMLKENEKLVKLRKAIADCDLNYIQQTFEGKIPKRMGAVEWSKHAGLRAAKEKTIISLREEVLSLTINNF